MTATPFYSSAASVITRTGIDPKDLGFGEESSADDALEDFLEELLTEASDLMDRIMQKSYLGAGAAADSGNDQADDPDSDDVGGSFFNGQDPDSGDFQYTGTIPAGLNGIAADVVSDWVRTMVMSRQTPVVRIDDFAVKTVSSRTLTPDVRDRLKLYGKGRGAHTVSLGQDTLAPLPDILTAASLNGEFQQLEAQE